MKPLQIRQVYFDGEFLATKLFNIEDIRLNDKIEGPSIIIDKNRLIILIHISSYSFFYVYHTNLLIHMEKNIKILNNFMEFKKMIISLKLVK